MAARTVAVWKMFRGNGSRRQPPFSSRRGVAWSMASAALVALVCPFYIASASATESLEFAVKAAFIYKFASYVEWPTSSFSSPNSPFFVCVIGDDPISALLDQAVAAQQVNMHPIAVKHLQQATASADCKIAYVASADTQTVASNLDILRKTPVLTITDTDRTPDAVGIIGFTIRNNRVRFNIDDALAATDGLVISSKLLSLANSVKARH